MTIGTIRRLLVVVPQMVRVSALVHVRQVSVPKMGTVTPVSFMTNLKVALRTKQNTVAKQIRAALALRLPVMRLPTPVCPFDSVRPTYAFATGSTLSSLPVPSILYSVGRKRHGSTPHRVVKGWKYNGDDMWVLIEDGKSTNVAIMHMPPAYSLTKRTRTEYHIFHASKFIGFTLSLAAAKHRAEVYWKKQRRHR